MYLKRICILLLTVSLMAGCSVTSEANTDNKISVFGSSVASGAVAENNHGYWFMLKECLEKRGWDVSGCSRGGDRTTRILDRFDDLMEQNPNYVLIGLSVANEGIRTENVSEKDRVYRQFNWGLQAIIELLRSKGITPVVGLCYPNSDYTDVEYEYVKRMNLLINSWDVPSANFLGAIDDGRGRWVKGYENDPGHPNTAGHREMYYAIVPSLFDAIKAGKGTPQKTNGNRFLTLGNQEHSAVSFKTKDIIHSWSTVFSVRSKQDGALSTIIGKESKAELSIINGKFVYTSGSGKPFSSEVKADDGKWHHVAICHRYAQQETLFFIDGKLIDFIPERFEPETFLLGNLNSTSADFKEWLVYRAALNDTEVHALSQGQLLQASLEIYAPLQDLSFRNGKPIENRAQSLSQAILVSARK